MLVPVTEPLDPAHAEVGRASRPLTKIEDCVLDEEDGAPVMPDAVLAKLLEEDGRPFNWWLEMEEAVEARRAVEARPIVTVRPAEEDEEEDEDDDEECKEPDAFFQLDKEEMEWADSGTE